MWENRSSRSSLSNGPGQQGRGSEEHRQESDDKSGQGDRAAIHGECWRLHPRRPQNESADGELHHRWRQLHHDRRAEGTAKHAAG